MKLLSKQQIICIHQELINETGGSYGIRDEGMLESSLAAPFQSFDGTEVYPAIEQKAARLCFGLVMNHPFIDGNKRIGAHAMLVFLTLNGIEPDYQQEELIEVIMQLAKGETDYNGLLLWLVKHNGDQHNNICNEARARIPKMLL